MAYVDLASPPMNTQILMMHQHATCTPVEFPEIVVPLDTNAVKRTVRDVYLILLTAIQLGLIKILVQLMQHVMRHQASSVVKALAISVSRPMVQSHAFVLLAHSNHQAVLYANP